MKCRIKKIVDENNLSLYQLAQKTSISWGQIKRYSNGGNIRLTQMIKIKEALESLTHKEFTLSDIWN